ncbi:hypothetical protein BGZ83_009592 [Gryganskiella cystojenkinii]|nr:hypothetical protein BGZ83_009592 [Gryganskiella cystojenkinii]
MEIEIMQDQLTPRMRLQELKNSAEFPSEEFNHSIKTWVNMASLLVKQASALTPGNMAETGKDDENAYISYVRACLIVTKIIPVQAQYKNMMNDIVCIDLRQKILGTVARMGHLERRLLRRFEQESYQQEQQQVLLQFRQQQQQPQEQHQPEEYNDAQTEATAQNAQIESDELLGSQELGEQHDQSNQIEHLADCEEDAFEEIRSNTLQGPSDEGEYITEHQQSAPPRPSSSASSSEQRQPRLSMLIVDGAIAKVEQRIFEHEQLQQLQQLRQLEQLQEMEQQQLYQDELDLALEFDPHSYVSYHHSRYPAIPSGLRNSQLIFEHQDSPDQELDHTEEDHPEVIEPHQNPQEKECNNEDDEETAVEELPKVVLRKKKVSHEVKELEIRASDDALGKVMPSALFAQHREGMHVRRCSSTDAISRTNSMILYPNTGLAGVSSSSSSSDFIAVAASVPVAASTNTAVIQHSPRIVPAGLNSPVVPPRSEKRSSLMSNIPNHSSPLAAGPTNYSLAAVMQRAGTNSGPLLANASSSSIRPGIERDVLQGRFGLNQGSFSPQLGGNRRTMSFENGRQGALYQHQLQQQLLREQQLAQMERQYQQSQQFERQERPQQQTQFPPGETSGGDSSTSYSRNTVYHGGIPYQQQHHQQHHQQQQQQHATNQKSAFHNHPSSSGVSHSRSDLPPRPSIDKISVSSATSSGSSSSGRSGAIRGPSSSSQPPSAVSAPLASPLMTTSSFQINVNGGGGGGLGHMHGSNVTTLHAHTPSLASITSSTSTNTTMVDSPFSSSLSPLPVMTSSWTTMGKKSGLLRKIRSKSTMKDQLFDIVVVSPPQIPALSSLPLQQQQLLNRAGQTRTATMA